MTTWAVYTRSGCTLCEQLLEELAVLLGPEAANVILVDIADSPDLEAKYGARIPVLLADGEFVCAYRLDATRVRAYLQQ